MEAYYDARAPEYDEWYYGEGRFVDVDRPGWSDELEALQTALRALPAARTLDIACGTGFLTRNLRGEVVGVDQSGRMLDVAHRRLPDAVLVQADVLHGLPFPGRSFDRVFTGHFYGHLEPDDRDRFLAEARRLAPELVIVDTALRDGVEPEGWQPRTLNDGSRWTVFKRYFTGASLAAELGGGTVVHEGRWFVAVRA